MQESETPADDAPSAFAKAVARAWRDKAFRATLLADPKTALAEAGIEVPAGVTIKVLEDRADKLHLVIPSAAGRQIADADLEGVAGAGHRETQIEKYRHRLLDHGN